MNRSFKEALSPNAKMILDRLNTRGEAYLVGGAVRDLLLGREVHDEDITCSLLPQEVMELFPELPVIPSGLKHGTVTLVLDHRPYEITTFRSDGLYLDGRRPESVTFQVSLEEDLARRDFTINAMALDREGCLVDPFGGEADLERRLVRTVGDPYRRFGEDALRLLRAVRFAKKLDFVIEEATLQALKDCAPQLEKISRERIAAEFLQILGHDPEGVADLHEWGLLPYMYPELEACFNCPQETPWHRYDVGRHSVEAAKACGDPELRLAALCHDLGKPVCKTYGKDGVAHFYGHDRVSAELTAVFLRKLFLPKAVRRRITRVVALHDFISERKSKIARLVREEEPEVLDMLIGLQRADIGAQSLLGRERKLARVDRLEASVAAFRAGPHRLGDLALDGRDLVRIGYRGDDIEKTLQELLVYVMEKPSRNRREHLEERAARQFAARLQHDKIKAEKARRQGGTADRKSVIKDGMKNG